MMQLSAKVETRPRPSAAVAAAAPMPMSAARVHASRMALPASSFHGGGGASASGSGCGTGAAFSGFLSSGARLGGGGGGHIISPSSTTSAPRTASSSWSMRKTPSFASPIERRKDATLLPKSVDACAAHLEGRSVYPMHVTPLGVTTTSSFTVVAMLPPASAARSTVTDPRFMPSTCSCRMSFGAGLPGMRAVVMMMSHSFACCLKSSISASRNAWLISLAYPPAPSPSSSMDTSRNSAPMLSTCSRAALRTSKARTTAPMFFAVWIAARPATPAPITSTLAGGTLPAMVNCPAKKRPNALDASTTAR
mmetsp:Transcript_3340/g.11581  ORF Transcript_3340/g.11581 Transcript_3340/m.11581 type:complete len:308 (-) Transcript_3340:521-1444(-)